MYPWMRQAKRYKPAWAPRPPSLVMPAVGMDFVGKRGLLSGAMVPIEDLVTNTRASTGTYINSAGVLVSAAVNELRYMHDPITFRPLGILGEGARTNLCLRSNNHNTAPWTTAGATRTEATGTGPDNVLNSANLITIAASGGNGYYQTFTVTASTTYTWSQWVKLGTASIGDATMAFRDDTAGAFIATAVTQTGANTSTWTRVTYSLTTPVGCVLLRCYPIRSALGTGGTVSIYGAQLELGAFASTYIPTVASTVTRAADIIKLSAAAFAAGLTQAEGTILCDANVGLGINQTIWSIDDATTSEITRLRVNSAFAVTGVITDGGATQANMLGATYSGSSTSLKSALAYKSNDSAISYAGAAVVTDAVCTMPTSTQMVLLGATVGTESPFNIMRSLYLWPSRLVNSDLTSLATP